MQGVFIKNKGKYIHRLIQIFENAEVLKKQDNFNKSFDTDF